MPKQNSTAAVFNDHTGAEHAVIGTVVAWQQPTRGL